MMERRVKPGDKIPLGVTFLGMAHKATHVERKPVSESVSDERLDVIVAQLRCVLKELDEVKKSLRPWWIRLWAYLRGNHHGKN